jgi:hypothetical protein
MQAHVKRGVVYGIFSSGPLAAQQTIIIKGLTTTGPHEMRFWHFSSGVYFAILFSPCTKIIARVSGVELQIGCFALTAHFYLSPGDRCALSSGEIYFAKQSFLSGVAARRRIVL